MPEHRIYLLRHGETAWSSNGRHTGRTDIPLTPAGEQAAERAGRSLSALRGTAPALVLVSPRRRAQDTARLAALEASAVEPQLAEWDYGDYEGRTTPEIREEVPGWTLWTHGVPGGETAEQVARRADAVLSRARAAGSDVVLIGHGHFSRCLVARWLDHPVEAGVHYAFDASGITVLGHERGVAQLVHANVPPMD